MLRRHAPTPPDDPADVERVDARTTNPPPDANAADLPDLSSLSVAGLTRRRLAGIAGTLIAIWIVVVFARQVGDASAATARVEQMALDNIGLASDVAGLSRELDRIQHPRYVAQQARAYRLGSPKEVAFTLAADAPPLPDDAPGSASVRLGSDVADATPLDTWLTLLFGPGE